jgi:hypothetical protein
MPAAASWRLMTVPNLEVLHDPLRLARSRRGLGPSLRAQSLDLLSGIPSYSRHFRVDGAQKLNLVRQARTVSYVGCDSDMASLLSEVLDYRSDVNYDLTSPDSVGTAIADVVGC